ncbi:TonB-dependent receptor [Pedobacter sp. MC2016-24]|uniref:SusC/RagA family TonB-linked outer membrane protein n=1 Tax=Pedobacter sp. MC2016-24 TaxID=2780090 RepID=UPI00187F6962|nr:TonB-dependent receptor [Pedobacter sp. MC2016-24]MBE9600835.1 TonB-dependent receptor [Pedobacter sp. MC2016-24]
MGIFLHQKYVCLIKKYNFIKSAVILLLISLPFTSFSQRPNVPLINSKLFGKVIDAETKQAISGAVVKITGTTHVVATNTNGEFNFITGQKFPYTIVVSYIGYEKFETQVSGSPITIELKSAEAQLGDVLIVGYGTQKKGDITGSISKINAAEVNKIPVASFDAQLQGKAAGVQISTNSGVPGESIFVRVRGTTSINSSSDPLYVVDGIFLNNTSLQTTNLGGRTTSPLSDINPADIESIEILKDASATAIYGSRGANGVVLITTKRGSNNTKPKISFDLSNGWVQADRSTLPKLASGPDLATLANEYWINSGIDNPALNQTFANRPFRPASEGGKGLPEEQQNYDRINDILQKGPVQDYNLSIQGGSEKSKYYVGAGYTSQESLIKVPSFSRANLKFNFDQNLSNYVTFGLNNNVSRSFRNQARTGDGPQVSLWNSAVSTATYSPKYADDGTSSGADNVYILIDNYNVNAVSLRYLGNIYAEAKIIDGLKFKTSFSLDYDHFDESAYWNTQTSIGKAVGGNATSAITQNSTWTNEQTLTYLKNINDHHFNFLIGNSLQSNIYKLTSAEGSGFANDNFQNISSASIRTSGQTWTKYTLSSFFGRADYNYQSKYYLSASVRADGSSKFGTNNHWGYFPAFSAGWKISQESFLKDVSWLSELKLRGSYGSTGNQAGINNFASQGLWTGGSSYADVPGSALPGIGPIQLGNANLKWEKTTQSDFGIDVAFLKDRISITADYYSKYTSGLLLQMPIASSTGFSTYWANEGEMSNKGFEVGINTVNIITKDFTWKTSLNFSGNKNRIEKLPTQITQYTRDWVIMKEGYSMNSFWLYNQLSVNPDTGAPVFEGQASNGTVSASNRQILGNAYPTVFGGLNNTLSYKRFDLGFLFTFQYGNKALNLNRYFRERNPSSGSVDTKTLERWQKKGDITDIPRLTSVGTNYTIDQSSRYLEDASFLRLKLLTFGYSLPQSLVSKVNLTNVRVYFAGSNLKLWTKYTGDPESSVTSNPNAQGLGSFGTPPQPRGFQFGLNVTL